MKKTNWILILLMLLTGVPAYGASLKLSDITSGGNVVPGTDKFVTVRNGTTDVLTSVPVWGLANGGTGVTAAQGNGTKIQLSTGTTTTNNCVKFDANGNTVDAGSACSSGGGGITRSVSTISTNTAAGAAALTDYVYLVSNGSTLTLPTAVANTNEYTIIRTGTSTVTVATSGGQTIVASSTATLTVQYQSLTLVSDGANWYIK